MRTNARFVLLLSIAFFGAMTSHAQIKMDLRDVSDDDSPVRISGTVSFEDNPSEAIRYTFRTKASITNVSDRGILVTVIHFNATDLNGFPVLSRYDEVDRFFGPEGVVLEPGHTEKLDPPPDRFGAPFVNGEAMPEHANSDTSPTATGEVLFVQFIDGTVWGDIDYDDIGSGRRFFAIRNRTLLKLEELERTFNEQGEEAFKDQVLKAGSTFEFWGVSALVQKCRNAPSSCLITGLQSMLEAAAVHRDEMKKSGHASESGLVPE